MHLPELLATLPAELRDYIRALEGRASALEERNQFLEEQFRLAQLKRFAPSSEKLGVQGCLFNEAEQEAAVLPDDEAEREADVPTTPPKTCGRRALPAHLPRKRVEHDLPEAEKAALAARASCTAWAKRRANSSTSFQPRCRYSSMCVSNTPAARAKRARSSPVPCRPGLDRHLCQGRYQQALWHRDAMARERIMRRHTDMVTLVETYLADKRCLGFDLRIAGRQLLNFAHFAKVAGHKGPTYDRNCRGVGAIGATSGSDHLFAIPTPEAPPKCYPAPYICESVAVS